MKNKIPRENNVVPFRVMHHYFHDDPEWHINDTRSEKDSIHSARDLRRILDKKFVEEFHGSSKGSRKYIT